MPQYNNKIILKALFFAPVLLLVILAGLFIVMNREYNVQALLTVSGIILLIYIGYCVITVPVSYAISVFLSCKHWLNLFTITLGSLFMWLIVTLMGYLIFTHALPTPIWKLFTDWFFYSAAFFAGCCYWALLQFFGKQPLH